jgi:hypothetical protein
MKIERQREIMDVVDADMSAANIRNCRLAGMQTDGVLVEAMLEAYRASAKGQK